MADPPVGLEGVPHVNRVKGRLTLARPGAAPHPPRVVLRRMKEIVEYHGGAVEVESVGRGTSS